MHMNPQEQNGRFLRAEEHALIVAMLPKGTSSALRASLVGASVVDLRDGAMGCIRFVRSGCRRRASGVAEAHYHDADGILVSIELNADESGELFELDFWKVDFSPLRRFPRPQDLRFVR
jgi:hypothetical protein